MSSIAIDHLGRDELIILLNRVAARLAILPDNLLLRARDRLPFSMGIAVMRHQTISPDLPWLQMTIGDLGMRRSPTHGTHIYEVNIVRHRRVLLYIPDR